MNYYLESEKKWILANVDTTIANKLSSEIGLSSLASTFLVNRGIKEKREALKFLNPSASILGDPGQLLGTDDAAQRIKDAIKEDELIYIYGDYDVDGITSTTLLYQTLKKLKANVNYHIPCRFKEGYGLNKNSLKKIIDKGAKLLITVDCGIKSFAEVDYAKKNGLDVIITDHHEPEENWPDALAVINPKLPHNEFQDKTIAGVGVALKLAQYLTNDPLEELYDLVALGTVADIAPLLNENRYLTQKGISLLSNGGRIGINLLSKAAGVDKQKMSAQIIGYALAPRLNASGRISNANICVELLSTNDENRAYEIAQTLNEANKKRQDLEEKMLREVLEKLEAEVDVDSEKVIFLADEKWHDGIKGIIASRIKEKFFRPTFIGTIKDGKIKASGRSIPNFSIHEALQENADILDQFGGHEKAGALSVDKKNAGKLKDRLAEFADKKLADEDLRRKIEVETKVNLGEFDYKLQTELEKLAPYGEGNKEPKVLIENIYFQGQRRLGSKGNHMRLDLFKDERKVNAIAFNMESFSTVLNHKGKADIVGYLEVNNFNGRSNLQLRMADLRLHSISLEDPSSIVEHLFANKESFAKKEEYENIGDADSFFTKVVGVTFDGRQEVIDKLKASTLLSLKREPDNEHDPNAIRVLTNTGQDLGFLNKRLAKKLAPLMDANEVFDCRVTDVTGGEGKNFGVNVIVQKCDVVNEIELENEKRINFKSGEEALEKIKSILLPNNDFHKYQDEALSSLLENKNTLAIMGTGRGKSAIFQTMAAYKALVENKISIILYPLRSLITDQYMFLKDTLAEIGLGVVRLSGDCSLVEREKIFEAAKRGGVDILLTTPEFLHHNIESFKQVKEKIDFLVVDEAHHLETSSSSHRPLYKKLDDLVNKLDNPLIMAATATAEGDTCKTIVESLSIEKTIIDKTVRENLDIYDKRDISNKENYLKELIEGENKLLIYVNSRDKAAGLANILRFLAQDKKDRIVYYHAGLSNGLRQAVQEGFMDSTFTTVVATSAFGEGVNIGDIRNIVLYHLPFSRIEYNQQSGRAGRDGNEAKIHLLFGEDDAKINELILESKSPGRKTLSIVWQNLKILANKDNLVYSTIEEINNQINDEYQGFGVNKQTVSCSLKIFKELGLIVIENIDSMRAIRLIADKKVDLSFSVAYEEGIVEKEQFNEFKKWAFSANSTDLLKMINQPIYPSEELDEARVEEEKVLN